MLRFLTHRPLEQVFDPLLDFVAAQAKGVADLGHTAPKGRGIAQPPMLRRDSSREGGTMVASVAAKRHDSIESRQALSRDIVRGLVSDIDPDFVHHPRRMRIDAFRLCAGTLGDEAVSTVVVSKTLGHLTSC